MSDEIDRLARVACAAIRDAANPETDYVNWDGRSTAMSIDCGVELAGVVRSVVEAMRALDIAPMTNLLWNKRLDAILSGEYRAEDWDRFRPVGA